MFELRSDFAVALVQARDKDIQTKPTGSVQHRHRISAPCEAARPGRCYAPEIGPTLGRGFVNQCHRTTGGLRQVCAASPLMFDVGGSLPSFALQPLPASSNLAAPAGTQACDKTRTRPIRFPLRSRVQSGTDRSKRL